MQSLTTMVVKVNDLPSELYDAKATDKSLLDILSPGEVKQVTINPTFFTKVHVQKGSSLDKNKVISSGVEQRLGVIGLIKSWDITWNAQKVLLGFHAGWHGNNMPRFRRRQFNNFGVQTFRGDNQEDQIDWLVLQLHPQCRQDILATISKLRQDGKEVTRKNVIANMVLRRNWTFEFKNPDLQGVDVYDAWEREQEVNDKIREVQEGHLQILMSDNFRGYKFFNQPTLAKSTPGARAYLVNKVKEVGGYDRMRKIFADLDNAIEVDQFVGAIKSGKVKLTDFEAIRTDNGKVFFKFEEPIPTFVNEEERVLYIKKKIDGSDGYKALATYLDELSKTSKSGAKSAKVGE
jgi:hypothetical protein